MRMVACVQFVAALTEDGGSYGVERCARRTLRGVTRNGLFNVKRTASQYVEVILFLFFITISILAFEPR